MFCRHVSHLCKTELLQTVSNAGVTHRNHADSERRSCYCLSKPEWARPTISSLNTVWSLAVDSASSSICRDSCPHGSFEHHRLRVWSLMENECCNVQNTYSQLQPWHQEHLKERGQTRTAGVAQADGQITCVQVGALNIKRHLVQKILLSAAAHW